jgi:hypothetical protein
MIALLVVWVAYLFFVHIWAGRKRLPIAAVIGSHAVPSTVAINDLLFYFLGYEIGISKLPVLLILTATSVLIHLVWTIIASVIKTQRKWVPVTICGVIMSLFAFATVFDYMLMI